MEKPNTIPWPPIIVICALVVGVLLHKIYPLPWLPRVGAELAFGLGLLLGGIALTIIISTIRTLANHNTTVHPTKSANKLVTSGPFSFSRNPIYLSNICLIFAVGLLYGSLWMFVTAIVAGIATQKLAIEREEAHLEHRFGRAWRQYRKTARRWI
ncbi:MAG: isoprenylcysteine carboxylmethyltransferase family protein [Rhizobiaceae bacterium]|nr:isoprenylcysteine carboxylmethyltransferase family protein [Rhizobiaceae bacterium]